jgi:uncharacterized membrane protein YdbT with pleckstrin-like domain
MGTYVESQLIKDEKVIYEAKVSIAVYFVGIAIVVWGLIFLTFAPPIGWLILLGALVALLIGYLRRTTTELVITNRRVIAKFGVISRTTFEQQITKIEGVRLKQDLSGRIIGYATVIVHGVGGGNTPIPFIAHPEEFKAALAPLLP